jgi:medium-chain acyl-[acyl-carrier-protein] hydrolase
MMTQAFFLEKDFFVSWHETDFKSKMTLKSISDMLMETAWLHAESLGFGFNELESQKYVWVLSRLNIEITNYPVWKDQLIVRTWPTNIEKLFANRDFQVTDSENRNVIKAGSKWLIINKESRRPVRPEKVLHDKIEWSKNDLTKNIEKIDIATCNKPLYEYQTAYSDIDFNQHVLNSKYIDILMNALPWEYHEKNTITSFQINYLSETKNDEKIQVLSNQVLDTFRLFRISDEKDVAHIKLSRH